MKIKQIIKKVLSVLQDLNGVYITKEKGLYDINETFMENGDYFNNSNDFIYGYDGDNTLVKIGNSFVQIASGYTSGCSVFSVDSIICYKLKLKENKVDYVFRNQNNLFDFSLDGRNIPISTSMNKIVFTDRKYQIFLYDLDNNITLWHYSLPEDFKIRGSVQAIDNVLFFIAMKDNHYQLVTGLDIETGNVIYQHQYEVTNANKFIVAKNLNPLDNLMYGYGHVYQVLNPKTGEILLQKTFVENQKYDLLPSLQAIYDDKLWFVSRRGESTKFGAVNLETSELDFIQDFPLENDGQLDKPVFHQNKLYLRDTNNVLYVLE